MTQVVFVIPGQLRDFSGGRGEVAVGGAPASVSEALALLWKDCPGIRDRVMTELGQVRPHVNIFVDGENIRNGDGLATRIAGRAEIVILPAVSGG